MGKFTISHDVDGRVKDLFENMCEDLGPPKYKVLEACVEVLSVLPREIQYRLKGQNEEDRTFCLDLIRALRANPQQKKRARQA